MVAMLGCSYPCYSTSLQKTDKQKNLKLNAGETETIMRSGLSWHCLCCHSVWRATAFRLPVLHNIHGNSKSDCWEKNYS